MVCGCRRQKFSGSLLQCKNRSELRRSREPISHYRDSQNSRVQLGYLPALRLPECATGTPRNSPVVPGLEPVPDNEKPVLAPDNTAFPNACRCRREGSFAKSPLSIHSADLTTNLC